MIFDDAVDEVKEAEQEPEKIVILATVTSLTSGKALVKFNGETESATKAYPYIEGYKPAVNDVVCMLKQGNTFVIIGKVSNSDITTNYAVFSAELATILADYLLSSTAASTYETQSHASSTYETSSHASSTYETSSHASSTYLSQSSASSTYLSKTDASSTYLKQTDASSTYLKKTDASSTYLSQTDASSTYLKKTDASSTYLKQTDASSTYLQSNVLEWSSRTLRQKYTYSDVNLGDSNHKFGNVYAYDLYGTTHSSSDLRLKKNIKTLGHKWLEFFYKLTPRSFKYKNGRSGRTHTGFIAQEVEQAANESGIPTKDIAAVAIDPSGQYYLGYEELIAVQTLAIHDLKAQIEDLTARIHDLERVVYK